MTTTPNVEPGAAAPADGAPIPSPRGFAVRCLPGASSGSWAEIFPLADGRTGVVLGCCANASVAERLGAQMRDALQRNGDSVDVLPSADGVSVSAVCAVIDATTITYGTSGRATVLLAPEVAGTHQRDDPSGFHALSPGATVVLSTAPVAEADLLGATPALHPDRVADLVVARGTGGGAAVVYRHPPDPMTITLPAAASSLAISRERMREWLAEAGIDPESCADVLLAVGEATANATEHSIVGADHEVHLTVSAALSGNRLQLTVSDDGRWKPATVPRGHRGHGMHLINALVDTAAWTTAPNGTTVEMLKELP